MSRITLDFLEGNSAEAAQLARIHAEEWGHLYREWNEQTALAEFRAQKNDGSLPATVILREDRRLAGSVSVVRDDCEARTDLGPWLASLFVVPERRGRGYGSRLVQAAVELGRRNNVVHLHAFTESAENLFLRHGFSHYAVATANDHAVTILRRKI